MSHESLLHEFSSFVSEAWRMTADAFAAADLLPLFAIWGLGLSAAEGVAWLDDRRAAADRESSTTAASLKA